MPRSGSSGPCSDGEQLTAAWLRQQHWAWEYEPEVEGRRLDFLAITPDGPVAFEVFEPEFSLPRPAGWFDNVNPLLGAFAGRKAKQIAAAKKAGLPLVMVIGAANSEIPYEVESMVEVMRGRLTIQIPLDSTNPGEEAQTILGAGGRVQPKRFRTLSALAAIRRFNPTKWRLEAAARARGLTPDRTIKSRRQLYELVQRREDLERELAERGIFDPAACLAQLVVVHNRFAHRPLSPGLFGLYDEHHGAIEIEGKHVWTHIASGRLARVVL
jgi:hypothetical protein